MSHKATVWAIQQRGLKPATKIVLWFLCDRHNPDFGCFPTQARLADDAEMSISALNEHLARLEELRLIHRVRVHDPRTHKRQATRYILAFEEGFPQEPSPETGDGFSGTDEEQGDEPSPESGHGAISGFSAKPSPDFAQSHLRNPETSCLIPEFDGALFSLEWKEGLWARFFTAAPPRQRQSVEQYRIVKRA